MAIGSISGGGTFNTPPDTSGRRFKPGGFVSNRTPFDLIFFGSPVLCRLTYPI